MSSPYADAVLGWYAAHARDLPWRAPGVSPWAVLVSEIMLQQTPVSRVLPAYQAWLTRWPTPAALAADPAGEAVRQWGRLGYPRRALRLHETAVIVTEKYAGELPSTRDELLALAGDRRLYGGRRGRLRLRAQARGPRHERPPRARPGGVRPRVPWRAALGSGVPPGGVALARRRRRSGALVGRRHGARRAHVHGGSPPLRRLPSRAAMRMAGSRPPSGRDPPGRPDLRGHRQAVPWPPPSGPQGLA